jgi:hypothetical protein
MSQSGIAQNRAGEMMAVMTPQTAQAVDIDGTSGHAESSLLAEGIYRLSVVSSTAGVRVDIGASALAVASHGVYMADQQAEYYFINARQKVSVLGGILNICPAT